MKQLFSILAIVILMAFLSFTSCSSDSGKGDLRDKNLELAMLAYLDSVPKIEYVGMSDVYVLDDNRLRTVIIFYDTDSIGNRIERNARVTTNSDCSEIYAWEDLDSKVLEDVKQKISDKFEEKGINLDDCLIDELIKLKRR
mgnify:CR=1 FL=1